MKLKNKLIDYIDSNYPVIYINSYEELKADILINELSECCGKKIEEFKNCRNESLEQFLEYFLNGMESLDKKLIVLKDVSSFLNEHDKENAKVLAMLKEMILRILSKEDCDSNIIIIASKLVIPNELENYISVFEINPPNFEEIKAIINLYDEEKFSSNIDKLATYLKGLSETEIRLVLNLALIQSDKSPQELILNEKFQSIKKSGILEMIHSDIDLKNIGGLEHLKTWLDKKAKVFTQLKKAQSFGVDTPKGVFILGMPGCGKSLTAKATAKIFDDIPLLRLDIGRIMGKYVGESEANMRRAIAQAEAIAPCVLWIDEIEKAFSGVGSNGSGGSEITTRLFGFFLTWMQEKTSEVYVVATANDISSIPLELLRKGRFDEVFFVNFPNKVEREDIFKLHIQKRNKSINSINIEKLAYETDGFNGADIENIVKEVIEEAFIEQRDSLTTDDYLKVIKNTTSLSKMLPDKVEEYKKLKEKMKIKSASEE